MRAIEVIRISTGVNFVKLTQMLMNRKIKNFKIKPGLYSTDFSHEKTWCSFESSPDQCLVNIHGIGYVSVIESPHYHHIRMLLDNEYKNENIYPSYLKEFYPDEDVTNTIRKFENLYQKIKNDEFVVEILAQLPGKSNGKIRIVDGTHRLAILTALGVGKIKFVGKI
jgi:hypothetical protein